METLPQGRTYSSNEYGYDWFNSPLMFVSIYCLVIAAIGVIAKAIWPYVSSLFVVLVCCLVAPQEAAAQEEIVGVYIDNDLAAYTIGEHYPTSFNLIYEFETIGDIQYGSDGVWTDQTHFESCFKALDFTATGYWIVSATASFQVYAKKSGVWGMYDVEVDIFGVKNVWQGGDEIDLSIDYRMTAQ